MSLPYTERTILLDLKFEGSKILLDTVLKIILDHQNNFGILKIISNAAKNSDILATGLSVLHNYFDILTKLIFCTQF